MGSAWVLMMPASAKRQRARNSSGRGSFVSGRFVVFRFTCHLMVCWASWSCDHPAHLLVWLIQVCFTLCPTECSVVKCMCGGGPYPSRHAFAAFTLSANWVSWGQYRQWRHCPGTRRFGSFSRQSCISPPYCTSVVSLLISLLPNGRQAVP